jgi:hypothetical protein
MRNFLKTAVFVQARGAAAASVKSTEKVLKELQDDLRLREEGDARRIPATDPLKKEKYFVSAWDSRDSPLLEGENT